MQGYQLPTAYPIACDAVNATCFLWLIHLDFFSFHLRNWVIAQDFATFLMP
jgi:hypothetical protein